MRKVYNLSRYIGSLLSVMPSLREMRDLLLLSHGSVFISKLEFLVLNELNISLSANLTFPVCQSLYGEFHLDDMEFDESLAKFRVEKRHLEILQRLFKYQEHDVILPTPFPCA